MYQPFLSLISTGGTAKTLLMQIPLLVITTVAIVAHIAANERTPNSYKRSNSLQT